LLHAARHHSGDEKILPEEVRERLTDSVLVTGNDRGVGDWETQWVSEQSSDREPVGEAADHRCLRKRFHIAERWILVLERTGYEEHGRHHDQQAGGDNLHTL